MSFTTSSNRILVTDSSSNIKFDTNKKYPYVIGTLEGSISFSNTITTSYEDGYEPPSGEPPSGGGYYTITHYFGNEIDQTSVLHSSAYPITFCFSSIALTGYSYVQGIPNNYFYYLLPANQFYSTNGSLLTELSVSSSGTVNRVAQISTYVNGSNQVVINYKRTGAYQDDQSNAATITFYYRIRYGRIV